MAGDKIDEAFVEIKPDVKDFDRDLSRDLNRAFERMEDKLEKVVDSIDDNFKQLIRELDIHFEHLTDTVDDAFDSIKHDAASAGRAIGRDIEIGADVAKHAIDDLADDADHDFDRIKRKARGSGEETGRGFFGGIAHALSTAGSSISSSLGSIFSGVGSTLGTVFGGGGDIASLVKVAAISALIPVVIALAGALSQLIGLLALLPGLLGVAASAIAPMIIAFQGFGEAIGAGFSGDVEKFNEALKNLAPSARAVIKEFVAFREPLSQLRRLVQQAFFSELVGQIKPLLTDILPVLTRGLTRIASALSEFFAGFAELLHANDILVVFRHLFESTERIIRRFGPILLDLFGTLFGVLEHSLPFVERFFAVMGDGLAKFSEFLSKAMASGDFEGWLEDAFRVAGQLWDLLKAVGGLLKTLFAGTAASGEDFIIKLTEMINKLNNFFANTKEGQETLAALSQAVRAIGTAVLGFGVALANVLRWGNMFVHWLIEAWAWIKSVGSAIGSFFSSIGSAIAGAWNALTGWISGAWTAVVGFFTALPGRIGAALAALPGILRDSAVRAFDQFFFAIGFGIGTVVAFFRDLPLKVWAHLIALWEGAKAIVAAGVQAVVNFFGALPGRVSSIVETTKLAVATKAVEMKNAFVARIRELVDTATNTARTLPSRLVDAVRDAVGRFRDVGRDIIRGMIDGIQSMVGSLVDAAKRAASRAWEGAKSALGIGSPSKEFAKLGKWSVQGFEKGFDDESDDARRRRPPDFPMDMLGGRGGMSSQTKAVTPTDGGTTLVAYLQIGDDQLHPVVVRTIEKVPQTVALAAEAGNTKLDRRR